MELSAYLYLPAAQGKHTSSSTQGKQKKNARYCFVDEETLSESWWQRLTLRRIQHPVLWWRYNINQVASSWLLVNISSAQGRFSKTLLQNGVFVENKKSIVTMSFDLPHGWGCLPPCHALQGTSLQLTTNWFQPALSTFTGFRLKETGPLLLSFYSHCSGWDD